MGGVENMRGQAPHAILRKCRGIRIVVRRPSDGQIAASIPACAEWRFPVV
jgi:hypothetical protein